MMRPHISYSELCEFANTCQHRWKLNHLDGLKTAIYSIHFDFGTSMHAALESHVRRLKPISMEHALLLFEKKLRWLHKKNGTKYDVPQSNKDIDNLVESGKNIINHLADCGELMSAQVMFNEFQLMEKIDRTDGVDIKFKGFVDIILKSKDKRGNSIMYVCDFKTCSWGWGKETKQDRMKHNQVFLYKHFLCKKFNLDPKNVRTAFILLKKKPPKGTSPIEFFPVSAGPVSVQRALDVLNSNITKMKNCVDTNTFEKNRNKCKDDYGNTCPYYKTKLCS